MKKEMELSRREELVLSVLWELEETETKVSCSDVIDKLKEVHNLDYAVTTVYTFLTHLVKKKVMLVLRERELIFTPHYVQEMNIRNKFYEESTKFCLMEIRRNLQVKLSQ